MFDFGDINADLITSSSCRLCLKNIGSHSVYESRENGKNLAEMLISITSLTDFSRDNGYPETVCSSCSTRIKDDYNLKLDCGDLKADCEKSEKIIEQLFLNVCVKEEEQMTVQSYNVEVPRPIDLITLKEEEIDVANMNKLGPTDDNEDEQNESGRIQPNDKDESNDKIVPKRSTRLISTGFNFDSEYRKHVIDKHARTAHKCEFCRKTFSLKIHLNRHLLKHSGEQLRVKQSSFKAQRRFKCDQCDKVFSFKSYLIRHQEIHKKTRYPSDKCDKTFSNQSNLKQHIDQIHLGVKMYKCEICKMEYYYKTHYHMHVHSHTDRTPFKCDQYDKAFISNTSLTQHSAAHGKTLLSTVQCKEGFNKAKELFKHKTDVCGIKKYSLECNQCHKNIHNGTGFKCEICNKVLSSKSAYNSHSLNHTGEKPFNCKLCNKGFVQSSNRDTHERIYCGDKRFRVIPQKKN